MHKSLFTFTNHAECHDAIGRFLEEFISGVVGRKGNCSLALPGGKSPSVLFQRLAAAPFNKSIPWHAVWFFWGDERCVSADHPDSNYGMARDNLLQPLSVPERQIFRMPAEVMPHDVAAMQYQKTLRETLPEGVGENSRGRDAVKKYPFFDIILLGMGEDGHTASLFPEHPVLLDTNAVAVVESKMALPPVPRLTLTLPVLNCADTVIFMVHGKKKSDLVAAAEKDPDAATLYPAFQVKPRNQLHWYLTV